VRRDNDEPSQSLLTVADLPLEHLVGERREGVAASSSAVCCSFLDGNVLLVFGAHHFVAKYQFSTNFLT